jgi:hypothetical protein
MEYFNISKKRALSRKPDDLARPQGFCEIRKIRNLCKNKEEKVDKSSDIKKTSHYISLQYFFPNRQSSKLGIKLDVQLCIRELACGRL